MQVIEIPFPKDRYGHCDSSGLSSYDLDYIEERGVETLIFYYGYGNYEGSGAALYRIGNKWGV